MLQGIVRGKRQPPRMVAYGPPKIGKSSFGADAPSPIFVCTEAGVDNLPVDQFPMAATWAQLVANVKSVADGEHEYQTLVLDTLNGAAELCSQHVCATQFKNNWGPGGFGSFGHGWAATSEAMRELLPLFDRCRARGMTVLLLAHTGVQSVRNPVDGDYQRFTPDLDRRVWARFAAWADVILRADYEYSVIERDGKRVAIGGASRVLRASGSTVEDAGCRVGYSLPATLPLSWEAFAAALGKGTSAADEIRAGWATLSADEQAKALAYLQVKFDNLDKAEPQRLDVIANRLRQRGVAQQPQKAA